MTGYPDWFEKLIKKLLEVHEWQLNERESMMTEFSSWQ